MRAEFNSDGFGKKNGRFASAAHQIRQGFGKQGIYPFNEEKAAMLRYLLVRNHAFVDDKKRIAAACCLHFFECNGLLYITYGQTIISNEAPAGLTLFVAAGKADEKETVMKLLVSVLNRNVT